MIEETTRARRFQEKRKIALVSAMNTFEELNDVIEYADPSDVIAIVRSLSLVERAMNMLQTFDNKQQLDDRSEERVLATTYHSNKMGYMCVVACRVNTHEPEHIIVWRAYISIVTGHNEKDDIALTRDWGAKLEESVARAYFPYLTKFKYKNDNLQDDSSVVSGDL